MKYPIKAENKGFVTLLGGRERALFALWLEAKRVEAGVSKSALANALGESSSASTQRVNRYFRPAGGARRAVFPTAATLKKIADALDLAWITTAFRAGYYGVALDAVRKLSELADVWARHDGVKIDDGIIVALGARRKCSNLPLHYEPFSSKTHGVAYVAAPTALALRITAAWFILRGQRFSKAADDFAMSLTGRYSAPAKLIATALSDDRVTNLEPRRWPRPVRLARQILVDADLASHTRRFAAAELVHAWAQDLSPELYNQIKRSFYGYPKDGQS